MMNCRAGDRVRGKGKEGAAEQRRERGEERLKPD